MKVYFEDGTTTIIYVLEDEDLQLRLSDLAEEEGVDVVEFTILGQVED